VLSIGRIIQVLHAAGRLSDDQAALLSVNHPPVAVDQEQTSRQGKVSPA